MKILFQQNPKVMKPNKIVGILVFVGIIGFGLYVLYMVLPALITVSANIISLGVFLVVFIFVVVAIFKIGKRLLK